MLYQINFSRQNANTIFIGIFYAIQNYFVTSDHYNNLCFYCRMLTLNMFVFIKILKNYSKKNRMHLFFLEKSKKITTKTETNENVCLVKVSFFAKFNFVIIFCSIHAVF